MLLLAAFGEELLIAFNRNCTWCLRLHVAVCARVVLGDDFDHTQLGVIPFPSLLVQSRSVHDL